LPIFCSNIAPFHQTGQDDVIFFDPNADLPSTIATGIQSFFADNPRHQLKLRVRHHYRWNALIEKQVVPLLEAKS